MLHRESHFNEVIETELLSEAVVELSALELLEEEDKNFGQAIRVLILDRQVVLTLKTANEALDEEVH